ncbi:MAG: polymer-forming cytoskeletal protein [Rhodocyclales bacterium]|nr:polymer-forming cytoskeletal protein [Rhodocyclales bacterium]
MSRKNGNANGPRSSAVTIIGPSASIKGNIAFSGYLRVQGSVVGNVTCNSDATGTTVIHGAGSVAGAIKTPNIVVGGRVEGPLEATESIEIHDGASVVGDTRYKLLAIQEGGSIDGKLIPTAPAESVQPHQERRVAAPEVPEIKELDGPHAHVRRASDHFWTRGKLIGVGLAVVALGVFAWLRQDKATAEPPEVPVAPRVDTAPLAPPEPVAPARVEEPPPTPRVEAAPPAPRPEPKPVAAPAPPPELTAADASKVVTVQGLDLDKPTDLFFVATREPVVLFKKQRSATGDGIRIELGSGAKRRFSIAENEVVRVARGKNLDMFYQGRKLSPSTVQSGAWISFVPLAEEKPAPQPQPQPQQ